MGTHTDNLSEANTFHSGILQIQKKIEEIAFCDNYIATQQALSDLREETTKVDEFNDQLKELKKKVKNEDVRENLSFELLVLEDYGLQKKRCLEESLYVSDLENVLQNVEREISERACYLIERPKVFESVYRGQDLNIATRLHKDSVYAVRNSWSWIRQVASCVEQHLKNAADYHQFFYDVRHLHEDMVGFLSWLSCVRMRRKTEARDPDTMIDHIRNITSHLLDYQMRAEKLHEQSRDVYPIHHRTKPIAHPLKAKALICYQHQDILILKDETCTLLDNTESKWRIRNSRGKEGEVPAVLLVIPPPDSRACSEIVRLREQLVVLWKAAVPSLRSHIVAFLNKVAKDTHTKELQTFSASEKTETMKLLNEAVQLFRGSSSDQTYKQFQHQIAGIRKILSQVRVAKDGGDNVKSSSAAYNTWYKAERVVMMYKNLLSYCSNYEDAVNSKTGREDILIQQSRPLLTYTSRAYFEKAKPVEINQDTKESSTIRVDAEIYIYERFSPKKLPKQNALDSKLLNGQSLTNGHAFNEMNSMAAKEVKSRKMKSFVITAVLDPNSQKKLSLLKAFSNGILDQVRGTYNNPETSSSMSIPEAISRGYVIVEYKDEVNINDCVDGTQNNMDAFKSHIDSSSIPVSGIVDPRTGEIVSVKEAISSGIIDMRAAKYINPVTKEEMTILEAMKNGYIQVEPDVIATLSEPGTFTHFQLEDVTYIIDSVINPTVNSPVSLKRALHDSLLDGTNGIYKNPVTGETMTVSEAIAKGFLNARIFNPALDKNDMNTISVKELRVKQDQYIAAHTEAALLNCDLDESSRPDPNIALYQKLNRKIDVGLKGIKDPRTLRTLSIDEAYHKGVLNFGKAAYDLLDGEMLPLPEATAKGLIAPRVLKEILAAYEETSLGALIDQEVFDSETGLVTDISNGQTVSLHAAVQQEILNPEMTFFYEVPSNKILSLYDAIESGRYDVDTGKYVKPDTNEELCFSKAAADKLIRVHIDPKKIADASESLTHLRHFMNTEIRGVHMPNTDVVSVDEAVRAGVLNIPEAVYVNEQLQESTPLIKAAKSKKMETPIVMQLFGALNKMSLSKKLDGVIHPVSGQVSSPDTGGPLCIQEATQKGLIKPDYIFFVDQQTGDIASLGSFIAKGKFDPVSGKFRNPTNGELLTIAQAIQEGLIDPSVTTEKYIENESSLRELIDERKINPRNSVFLAPEGQEIPLRDAMADGFLTMNSKVRIDPVTGQVMLASDEEVVRALVRVTEKAAWLQEVEKFLVDQTKPYEKLTSLKQQQGEHKTIHKDLEKEEPVVKSTLAHAEELLGTSNQSKKVEKDQQYQKLRYNTSDLKVRFDAASNEAETRTKKFDDLYEDLEDFYNTVEELDQWMDTAIEKGHSIKVSEQDPEVQYELFKKHVEELKAKESEISELVKLADKFRDDTQEFMNGVDRYRKHVHILPTIKEETEESAMIDDEIEALEEKFRDITQKCTRYLEKLFSVVKHRKGFTELANKMASIYPDLESKISVIDEESSAKSPKEMTRDLENLKYIKANLLSQEKRVRDLQHVGSKLVDELADLNMKPLAGEVKTTMEEQKATHKNLYQTVESKEVALSSALTESKSVIKKLDNLNSWVSVTEELLSSKSPICLDKENLEEHLHEQRRIHGDVGSYRALLENLSKEANDMDGAEEKLAVLDERMENLEKLSNNRILELEGVIGNIEDLEDQMNDMKSWLAVSFDSIQHKPKGTSHNPHLFKAKIDALYAEKKGKESDMNSIKQLAKQIMQKKNVSNGYQLKEAVAGVQEQWHDLTELLVQEVSLEALSEIESMLRYMDKAENEINTAEPVSSDPETLTVQLRDHKVFHHDLNSKRNSVKDIISKCNRMLRETTNTQTEAIKSRLDSIQTQADIVCQLSSDRLQHLESALPLASHFTENQVEILAWLDEMEAELKAQSTSGENLDQVKKQLDNLKVTQQIIADHKPFVEDLSDTGMELIELCGDEDADDLQGKLSGISTRYDLLKTQAREKAHDLNENRKLMTQEVSDTLENLLEDLAEMDQIVMNADPIPAIPEKLRDEIDENKRIMERLHRHQPHVENAQESVAGIVTQGVEDEDEIEEMKTKMIEICKLSEDVSSAALERDRQLNQARKMSTKFYDLISEVGCTMKDLKDNLYSQEPPGIDSPTIKEQQKELMEIKQQQENAVSSIKDSHRFGEKLSALCGDPGKIEVQKQLEDLDVMAEDLNDTATERAEELNLALGHAYQFQIVLDAIMSWLPVSQHKLSIMKSPSADKTVLKDQIEELKLFKMQTHPHVTDVDNLNQHMTALNDLSPVAAESLLKPVDDVNERWNDLLRGIADREASLHQTQVKVGELEHAIESIVSNLENSRKDLSTLDNVIGDPKCIETQMKKLQLIQDDLKNQSSNVSKLNKTVSNLTSTTEEESNSSLHDKTTVMNKLLREVQVSARDHENKLQETLREVKKFTGDVDDMLHWVNDLRMELKSKSPFGALPEAAKAQLESFNKRCAEVEMKEDGVKSLLLNGQDMIDRCRPEDVRQLSEKLRKLKDRWYETKNRALRRRDKMQGHLKNVEDFHSTLKVFTDWLNSAETTMRTFKYPSKIVEKVQKQIEDHNVFKNNVQSYADRMHKLDRTGTYLKYFGRKQDTIYIKNLLVGIRLRWKKLLRRTDERGRLLNQANCEDKRFYESWKSLCDWLDSSETMLSSFLTPHNQMPSNGQSTKMKEDMEELKKKPVDMDTQINQLLRVKLFQHQLAAKHPSYYSTTRLGRNLKDRCTKTDSDRDVLQAMLDQLKNKWNLVRSVVSKSQNKLDEALLTSGRVSDAVNSLQEWLSKAETTLSDDLSILGDYDTVNLLIEQHKSVQQELLAREQTLEAVKSAGNIPEQHLDDLIALWNKINLLCESRETRLKEALTLADEFQEVVQVMREFLPTAEAELKFRPLPDDEFAIIHLIERHEKFQEQLRNHQDTVDKIKTLAEEILLNCHPNAIRFVKYYLTITQTRWDQLVQRARSRAQRLQESLKSIQGNAALLEELLAWLTDAQVLLATKEKDPIPHDLNVVETLLKEHLELHEDVTSKNADVDRLTKIVTCESKLSQGRHYGSNWKLNEMDGYNPRVVTLQNKWRTVWRMSVDRKKKLQDAMDTLLELESFKNFDFDLWRQRYLNWIQEKKFRITDFFRRQDKDCDGALTRREFVDGMLQSKFPTNKTELNAVFDIFDQSHTGKIDYRNFTDAMKPDRHKTARMKTGKRQATDSEMIHDEIERQVSTCQCRHQFKAERIDEGQYRFGENLKLKLVRFLNSCVMVRVGGGWVTLDQFLETNDPCRAKGRTTTELRESFVLAEGVSQTRAAFRSKTPDPLSKKRLSEGYASSNSSAGSYSSPLRRSKVGSSMINLSMGSSPSTLYDHPDFGSTGSLSRSKRLSSSSNSLSSTKSPRTPKTPGTPTGNTRPKTPMANSKSSQGSGTSTPVRSRSVTPNPTRSVTPNPNPLRMGAQRRLPTTPKTPTRPKTPTNRR